MEIHLLFSGLLYLLDHFGEVDFAQFGQVVTDCVEDDHSWMFLLHVLIPEGPESVLIGRIFLLIEKLFCLQ